MDNSTPNNSEKLVQYLDGELNETEQAAFLAEIGINQELADELENFQLAREVIRKAGLKQQVASIHKEAMNQNNSPRIGQRNRILRYVAAAAAAILILFAINIYTKSSKNPDKLFADNYQTYQLTTSRGSENAQPDAIEKAFQEKNYTLIADLPTVELSSKDQFLKGIAFTELGNYREAANKFSAIISNNVKAHTSQFNDDAEYYLSLVYLRLHDYPSSLQLMQQIKADSGHIYNRKITPALLEKVRELID